MAKIELLGGKPDLKKLAKAGRIKLKFDGDVENQPVNPVLYTEERPIKHESGLVIGTLKIPVNGGHAHMEGSVWRVALGGPKKYHAKVLKDEQRKAQHGPTGFRPAAPMLDFDSPEANEYEEYKTFLKEKGVEIAEDAEFYEWVKSSKKKAKKETV